MSYGLGTSVDLPAGRRLVIPDIHGCAKTLEILIHQLDLSFTDQLFFLGDYINKGPNSLGVLTFIEELIGSGYQVFPLLGNHDQMMLQYLETRDESLASALSKLNDIAIIELSVFERHLSFFRQLAPYYESGDFLLVHAGFDFNQPLPFSDLEAMLNIRDFRYDATKAAGRRIVHGHYPHSLPNIQSALRNGSPIIPLDNGCVYENREEQGNLLCLNLDTFKLWVQPNIERQ